MHDLSFLLFLIIAAIAIIASGKVTKAFYNHHAEEF